MHRLGSASRAAACVGQTWHRGLPHASARLGIAGCRMRRPGSASWAAACVGQARHRGLPHASTRRGIAGCRMCAASCRNASGRWGAPLLGLASPKQLRWQPLGSHAQTHHAPTRRPHPPGSCTRSSTAAPPPAPPSCPPACSACHPA
eukprot:366013-Chlamydomonas_euryale.AAC.7